MIRKCAIAIIFSLCLLLPGISFCQGDEILEGLQGMQIIPVPAGAEEIRKETSQIMGNDCLITIYETPLSFKEVAKFYRQRLGADDWQDITQDKKFLQNFRMNPFSDTLIFIKGDNLVNVQNLTMAGGAKRVFSVGQTKADYSAEAQEQQKLEVQHDAQTKDIPIYPNATLDNLSTYANALGQQWGYVTSDSAESVLNFYRQNMPAKGWKIEQEMPATAEQTGEHINQEFRDCPKCKQILSQFKPDTKTKLLNSTVKMGSIQFRKDGQFCIIAATETEALGSKNTIIAVLYNPQG